MDLHFTDAIATEEERDAIDEVVGPPDTAWNGGERDERSSRFSEGGRTAAQERRHLLLPALRAVQGRIGWVSPGALNYLCARLSIPPAEAYGVATFYALLSTEPQPPTIIHMCDDIACKTAGADALCAGLESQFGPAGSPCGGGRSAWKRSPCLGLCDRGPAAFVQCAGGARQDFTIAPASAEMVAEILTETVRAADAPAEFPVRDRVGPLGSDVNSLSDVLPTVLPGGAATKSPTSTTNGEGRSRRPGESTPQRGSPGLKLLARVGDLDPQSLDEYRAAGGYSALRRALEVGPSAVIRELSDARLTGRGGAAFSTSVKWKAVASAAVQPHYVICNADESEPGTFKDRVLMEEDPFAVVESLTIAGFVCGAEKGFIYIRGEYPEATRRLENALKQSRARGLLGGDILARGFRFEIEIRSGGGAYICGEETALLNSIEGRRGEPRNKPPFPAQVGLFGKPTAINNVETLVNVLPILATGGLEFADGSTSASTGTRLFCLSGCVVRPGVYEIPYGMTLGRLLDLAGGVRPGRKLQAILLGGAAGVFVRPDELDIPLTIEGARAAGATLGSGVVMVFDDTVDMGAILVRIASFFRDESCGQCVPCRVGAVRQEEALQRLLAAPASADREIALLQDLDQTMRDASICGLGQTAGMAILSAIHRLKFLPTDGAMP